MLDAWKGESLIRNIKPAQRGGQDNGGKMAKRMKDLKAGKVKRFSTCAVTNCNAPLGRYSKSGVCRRHNHLKPFCECKTCKPKD